MRLASTSSECSRKAEPPTLHDWRTSELLGSLAVGNTLSFWKLWDIHKRPSVPHLPLAHGRGARRRGGRAEQIHAEGAREAPARLRPD